MKLKQHLIGNQNRKCQFKYPYLQSIFSREKYKSKRGTYNSGTKIHSKDFNPHATRQYAEA